MGRSVAELGQNLGRVAVGTNVVPCALDPALLIDQEGRADHPRRRLPVEQLLAVSPVLAGDPMALVAEQHKCQPVPGPETPMAVGAVCRDSEDVDPDVLEADD